MWKPIKPSVNQHRCSWLGKIIHGWLSKKASPQDTNVSDTFPQSLLKSLLPVNAYFALRFRSLPLHSGHMVLLLKECLYPWGEVSHQFHSMCLSLHNLFHIFPYPYLKEFRVVFCFPLYLQLFCNSGQAKCDWPKATYWAFMALGSHLGFIICFIFITFI